MKEKIQAILIDESLTFQGRQYKILSLLHDEGMMTLEQFNELIRQTCAEIVNEFSSK